MRQPVRRAGRIGGAGLTAAGLLGRIDGQSDTANKRITDALGIQDTQPESEPGDEGDDDSEQAS